MLYEVITGQPVWNTEMVNYEPKELLELPLPDGSSDIIAAEYFSIVHRLNSENGSEVWNYPLGSSAGVIQMALINDLNSDDISVITSYSIHYTKLYEKVGGLETGRWY